MTPNEHYEEAERLLERSEKLTEDWARKAKEASSSAVNMKLLHLEILSRMLTSRADVHALLATAKYQHRPSPVSYSNSERLRSENVVDVSLPEEFLR